MRRLLHRIALFFFADPEATCIEYGHKIVDFKKVYSGKYTSKLRDGEAYDACRHCGTLFVRSEFKEKK